jgi:alpha-L-rhamnosidase
MRKSNVLQIIFLFISVLVLVSFRNTHQQSTIYLSNLRCEYLENPVGIDVYNPRLSWEINSINRNVIQYAYQIIVSSTPEKLTANEGDLWNSGKVESNQSIQIKYEGIPLKSRTHCFWKVKIWSNYGESEWSLPAYWSMGLLNFKDWQAKWIGIDRSFSWDSETTFSRLSARYLRKEFELKEIGIKQATVYIIGLGLYELYINGKRIGNQVLAPVPTDYTKTVKYNTFNITGELKNTKNAIGVILGNGRFYTMRQGYKPYKIKNFGYPKLLLQLEIEYANGDKQTIISDSSWKITADGPIRSNNEYDGEEYDARKEMPGWNKVGFDDTKWINAEYVQAPTGEYTAQMNENMKIMETVKPRTVSMLASGKYIIDMGRNIAGWLKLSVKGMRGDRVVLRFAETLQANGELNTANLRDAKATDIYVLKGEEVEIWEPSFVYHGFRFVEVTGYPGVPTVNDFEGKVVYDNLSQTGSFVSSDSMLNHIYENAYRGISSNYKGMPVDCPQRNERQPWLGDRAAGSLGESFIFDISKLYTKWLADIEQSQKADGCIPDVAPAFWNYYTDNMTWPGTYLMVADMLYKQYGDVRVLEIHYQSMKRWLAYMKERYLEDYIMTKDSYGDWCVPPESPELIHTKDSSRITDKKLIATAYYYYLLKIMIRFAEILEETDDIPLYSQLADNIRSAFNKHFFNVASCKYSNNTVTANLLPLAFGIVPDKYVESVFNNIIEKIVRENNYHISTGVIGNQWLMHALTQYGRADVALKVTTNPTYPGWGYMIENGATTIWELWNGNTADPSMNSHNHVMLLGDLISWMYEDLAGIKSHTESPGFKKIVMKPEPIEGLDSVSASYHSVHGLIKSAWKKETDRFIWNISIPCNTKAEIYVPASSVNYVAEGGKSLSSSPEIKFLRYEDNKAVFEIGSGNYSFVSLFPWRKGILIDEFIFMHSPFPESHAATIAETKSGIVVAWFGGTKERNPDVAIWCSRNENGRWTKPIEIANGRVNDTLQYPCWNPVLYQIPGGELLLFYKTGPKPSEWTGWIKSSPDAGLSWSKAAMLPEGFIGPVKNKPLLLDNGKLICGTSNEDNGWKVYIEATSDFGKTWIKTPFIEGWDYFQAIQPTILKHKDSKIQILCRSKNRTIVDSWSFDGGNTWSPLRKTSLPNNNSGIDAVTLKDGRHILVYNHVKPAKGQSKGSRTPLNVAISDDGKTWYATLVLEDSPIGQYSYPSVIQTSDGLIHVVYTWRRETIKHVVVDPSKLVFKRIINGKWPRES